jgi:hypothetical protein
MHCLQCSSGLLLPAQPDRAMNRLLPATCILPALLLAPCLLQLLPALLNADGLSKAVNLTLAQGWLPDGEQTWFLRTSDNAAPGVTDLVMLQL